MILKYRVQVHVSTSFLLHPISFTSVDEPVEWISANEVISRTVKSLSLILA